jgi:hypothetical protein
VRRGRASVTRGGDIVGAGGAPHPPRGAAVDAARYCTVNVAVAVTDPPRVQVTAAFAVPGFVVADTFQVQQAGDERRESLEEFQAMVAYSSPPQGPTQLTASVTVAYTIH